MKKKHLLVMAALSLLPMMAVGQSTVEAIGNTAVQSDNNPTYEQWFAQYEAVGNAINEISAQYQEEVNRRGYPKKKTVKKKIALVEQYVQLLQQQLYSPELNQNIDTEKVERKISEWQTQLDDLNALLKKI